MYTKKEFKAAREEREDFFSRNYTSEAWGVWLSLVCERALEYIVHNQAYGHKPTRIDLARLYPEEALGTVNYFRTSAFMEALDTFNSRPGAWFKVEPGQDNEELIFSF